MGLNCLAVSSIPCRTQHPELEMPAAERHIVVIGAKYDLFPIAHNAPAVKTRITGRLSATPAHCLNLLDDICNCYQPLTSGKQIVLKICPQPIAHDGTSIKSTMSERKSICPLVANCTSSTIMQS